MTDWGSIKKAVREAYAATSIRPTQGVWLSDTYREGRVCACVQGILYVAEVGLEAALALKDTVLFGRKVVEVIAAKYGLSLPELFGLRHGFDNILWSNPISESEEYNLAHKAGLELAVEFCLKESK